MQGKSLMIQGTASSVGKSLLTAGFCRIFMQDGHRVAPFKSQNMALNSFITKRGKEMGRAQVVQAQAAGIEPTVEMNPILIKPTSDKKAQIIFRGEVHKNMNAADFFAFKPTLKGEIKKIYNTLEGKYDYILIEGAGSPAEINLKENDIVNMGMAEIANAPVILVGDIDKGGVFAFLTGTIQLLTESERRRIKGVIINKFRGDIELLRPGLKMLEEIIHKPVLGVIPYMNIDIEDEDIVTERLEKTKSAALSDVNVAVIRLPHMSNFTDFNIIPLQNNTALQYVENPADFGNPDIVILPGSKNTIEDLIYIKSMGFDTLIKEHASSGKLVIGICGGYQMLANKLRDPHRTESNIPVIDGLGLLDMDVDFMKEKTTAQAVGELVTNGQEYFIDLGNVMLEGYEIHMGENIYGKDAIPCIRITSRNNCISDVIDGVCNRDGNVFGTYMHGVFDNGSLLRGLLNNIRRFKGLEESTEKVITLNEYREKEFDRLAFVMRNCLDMDYIYKIINGEV